MIEYLALILLISFAAAFIILFCMKMGYIEELQTKGSKLISEWASCSFCQCFWASMFICIIAFFVSFDFEILIIPIFSTPIARHLI